ncbi:hypothetical protein [Roseicyclus persicicus]|uniref:Uncharacterized protein n=1 Tax=Roseicyclus persicicus TaxID=2650661 RepID=A0A7X6GWI4_9RHOB|nr:hypothetical protein [Roseibacterium persicicum]NKX43608.1 hypothetical protein [Roseibacterium persicicum]
MSDPAKSATEIEDVLASIRRLVADSGSAASRAAAPPADAGDKLVLTPALRVTDPDDPWAPVRRQSAPAAVAADTAADDDGDDDTDDDPEWGLEDRLADWGEIEESGDEAVAEALAEGHADDTGPPPPLSDPAPRRVAEFVAEVTPDEFVAEVTPGEFEPETGDADWPGTGADRALRELAIVRGQAAAEPDPAPEAEPEAVETAAWSDAAPEPAPHAAEGDAADAPEMVGAETADWSASEPQMPPDTPDEAASPMTPDDRPEAPADAETADPGFTPIFSRRTEARRWSGPADGDAAGGDAHAEIEDLGETETPFTFPDPEEGILDEETLRELIAEVIREELQGVLGQRITRNVRKMVRREIRLALAAEDFE